MTDENVVELAGHKARKPAKDKAKTEKTEKETPRRKPLRGPSEDGAALLDEVRQMICRYVVLPSQAAEVAVTLYAAATHAAEDLQCATRLVIRSPEPRCGKSRLLEILKCLCPHPVPTVSISPAALVHAIPPNGADPPTLLIDEFDTVFGKSTKDEPKAEALRAMINAGFNRGASYIRHDPMTKENYECPTFAMAVLAGIGSLPDTIEDRAVVISLRRKLAGQGADRYRVRQHQEAVKALGERLARWVLPQSAAIADDMPDMPDGLNDRQEDAWECLIAVADAAGGDWPKLAREAAQTICGAAEEKHAANRRLLADLRDIFNARPGRDRLRAATIIPALSQIEEAPWKMYNRGDGISDNQLGGLLAEYDVKTKNARYRAYVRDPKTGKKVPDQEGGWQTESLVGRHYFRADLEPVWAAYAPVGDADPSA
jgi:hypothetical protein